MLKSVVFVLACSLLGGCVTAPIPPAIISNPVEVKIPVPVPCVKQVPAAPTLSDDKSLLTGSGAQVFDNVWADHLSRRNYEGELSAAIAGCVIPKKTS